MNLLKTMRKNAPIYGLAAAGAAVLAVVVAFLVALPR